MWNLNAIDIIQSNTVRADELSFKNCNEMDISFYGSIKWEIGTKLEGPDKLFILHNSGMLD